MKSKIFSVLFSLLLVLSFSLIPAMPSGATVGPVTKTYPDITLPASLASFTMPDIWDLNAGPVTIRYTLDLSGAPNVAYDWNWNNMGIVGLFSGGSGVRMCGFLSDWENRLSQFPTYPDYPGTQDLDDKFNMQRFPSPGSYDEQMYNVNFATDPPTIGLPGFNPWANYGIWFDRDGVDQWQAQGWGMVNGGTYNTNGVYGVELKFTKSSATRGIVGARMFPDLANSWDPTGFGIGTGFYITWKSTGPDYYPTGISFDTDVTKMGSMKVYVQGSSDGGTIVVKNLTVTGYLANRPPTVMVNNGQVTVDEGQMATNTGTWSDPDGDSVTLTASVGAVVKENGTWSWSYQTTDGPAQSQAVTITATDEHGAVGTATFNLIVNNVPPVLMISAPTVGQLFAVNTPVNVTGTFTDPGILDTHTVDIVWDDGSPNTTLNLAANVLAFGPTPHTYASAGVYTISVTVTDKDGVSDTKSVMVVVYDPSAGFVTGGGWINSLAGAYAADATMTGKATFGFVSKYQRGAQVPTGQTEFQFHVANFNFHSESYQWLVVAGAKAQYKGTGTVNGVAGYGFLLTATDGQLQGGGGVDKFRIKIWQVGGAVVYDNVVGSSDDIDAANPQAIGGGSIVIHSK